VLFSVKNNADGWDKGRIVVQLFGDGERRTLVSGGASGRYLPSGHLVYARSGVLHAVHFDLRRLAVLGPAVPVLEGVRRGSVSTTGADPTGVAQPSYSNPGPLACAAGPASASRDSYGLALFDRKGGVQPLKLPEGVYASPRVSRDGKLLAFERLDG